MDKVNDKKTIVCGVEVTGDTAIFAVVKQNGETVDFIETKLKKLILKYYLDYNFLMNFIDTVKSFVNEEKIDVIVIKSRAMRGLAAGSGVTYKIDTLIQLAHEKVVFCSQQTLAKFAKTNQGSVPEGPLKYQHEAFRAGAHFLTKS